MPYDETGTVTSGREVMTLLESMSVNWLFKPDEGFIVTLAVNVVCIVDAGAVI